MEDSDFVTRAIGQMDRFLVARPGYVASKPKPMDASDLEDWNWIRFDMCPDQTELTSPDGRVATVAGRLSVSVNSAEALYKFAARGLGLTAIPEHLACRGFDRGDLVQVLPEWKLRALGPYAVWPNQSFRENLTTLFVRYLAGEKVLPAK